MPPAIRNGEGQVHILSGLLENFALPITHSFSCVISLFPSAYLFFSSCKYVLTFPAFCALALGTHTHVPPPTHTIDSR
jgi:hypothetical protein